MNFKQPALDEAASAFILEDAVVNFEYPVHLFLADPFDNQPAIQVLYIAELEGKVLVAVPYTAWSKQVSKRILPATSLTKVNLVEVQCCRMSDRTEPVEHFAIKLRVGFLKRQFEKHVHTGVTAFECDHYFGEADEDHAESGFVATGDPMQDAVQRLTSIVQALALDKKKKPGTSRIDQALDGIAGSSTDASAGLGSGKKSAAARRCLRTIFQDQPSEIASVIEKLMFEDLNSVTLGPGQLPLGLNARAWVEYRSRRSNYKTSAHASWGVAGILDSIISGDIPKARARAGLLLLQLDQASIDRGQWSFAADLSMEGLPPFSALAAHQAPSLADGEQPFSRLLDPRWAEVTLGFLRDQDDFLVRRKTIGKSYLTKNKDGDSEEADPKKKAKAKAKNKASQNTQQDA